MYVYLYQTQFYGYSCSHIYWSLVKYTIARYETYRGRSSFPRTNDIIHPILPSSLHFWMWEWKEICKAVWTIVNSHLHKHCVTLLTVVSPSSVYCCCFRFWIIPQTWQQWKLKLLWLQLQLNCYTLFLYVKYKRWYTNTIYSVA